MHAARTWATLNVEDPSALPNGSTPDRRSVHRLLPRGGTPAKHFFGWEPHLVRDVIYLIALAVVLFALLHNATHGYAHGGEILLAGGDHRCGQPSRLVSLPPIQVTASDQVHQLSVQQALTLG
jgi:hypothetical protein